MIVSICLLLLDSSFLLTCPPFHCRGVGTVFFWWLYGNATYASLAMYSGRALCLWSSQVKGNIYPIIMCTRLSFAVSPISCVSWVRSPVVPVSGLILSGCSVARSSSCPGLTISNDVLWHVILWRRMWIGGAGPCFLYRRWTLWFTSRTVLSTSVGIAPGANFVRVRLPYEGRDWSLS